MKKDIFTSSIGVIIAGAVIGAIAAWLSVMGNPANMGICMSSCCTIYKAGINRSCYWCHSFSNAL